MAEIPLNLIKLDKPYPTAADAAKSVGWTTYPHKHTKPAIILTRRKNHYDVSGADNVRFDEVPIMIVKNSDLFYVGKTNNPQELLKSLKIDYERKYKELQKEYDKLWDEKNDLGGLPSGFDGYGDGHGEGDSKKVRELESIITELKSHMSDDDKCKKIKKFMDDKSLDLNSLTSFIANYESEFEYLKKEVEHQAKQLQNHQRQMVEHSASKDDFESAVRTAEQFNSKYTSCKQSLEQKERELDECKKMDSAEAAESETNLNGYLEKH